MGAFVRLLIGIYILALLFRSDDLISKIHQEALRIKVPQRS